MLKLVTVPQFVEVFNLLYSKGVGLPVSNVCQRDLVGARITVFRGIFNSTTNFILGEMLTVSF